MILATKMARRCDCCAVEAGNRDEIEEQSGDQNDGPAEPWNRGAAVPNVWEGGVVVAKRYSTRPAGAAWDNVPLL